MCERDPSHLPMLVLLCRVLRPISALPCRDILPLWRLLLISNLQLLCAHVVYCSPACRERPPWRTSVVLPYSLLPLVNLLLTYYPRACQISKRRLAVQALNALMLGSGRLFLT